MSSSTDCINYEITCPINHVNGLNCVGYDEQHDIGKISHEVVNAEGNNNDSFQVGLQNRTHGGVIQVRQKK